MAEKSLFYEEHIKALVLTALKRSGLVNVGSIVASEFSLGGLIRRVDLAVMSNCLIGIEIKSEFDTLKRLDAQIDVYKRVFDQVIIVAAEKHIENILHTASDQVSIWILCSEGMVRPIQNAKRRPHHVSVDLARVLTTAELQRTLELPIGIRRNRHELIAMAANLPVDSVRVAMHNAFANRFGTTSKAFWSHVQRGSLTSEHLQQLSRFKQRRKILANFKAAQDEFWRDWSLLTQSEFGEYNLL